MGVPPSVTAAGQLISASLILSPLSLILDKPWSLPLPGADGMAALLGLALLSTSLAYILYFRILSSAGATNVLLVTFLIPVSAMILGGLFLGEIITSGQLVGMVVIGMGLLLIDGRVIKQRKVV